MPNLIVFSSIISLYLCGFICKGWVWEICEKSSFKDESVQFMTNSREAQEKSNLRKGHVWSTWLEVEESQQAVKFASVSREGLSHEVPAKLSVWQKDKVFYQIIYPHYKYPHYPRIIRSAFQRENFSKYTWELDIVILTIICTFLCGFSQLLPLHLYILERLIVQILTTLDMSVKWGFGVVGRHWNEPFSGGCNRAELRDLEC